MGTFDRVKIHESLLPDGISGDDFQTQSMDYNFFRDWEINEDGTLSYSEINDGVVDRYDNIQFHGTMNVYKNTSEGWIEFNFYFSFGELVKVSRLF